MNNIDKSCDLLGLERRIIQPKLNLPECKDSKPKNFATSAHLADLKLNRYNKNISERPSDQFTIFDSLSHHTKEHIKQSNVSVDFINRAGVGIDLTGGEIKLLLCLTKMLHEKSQTFNPSKNDYYSGNLGEGIPTLFSGQTFFAPRLSFTMYELTKEYTGGKIPSGADIKNVYKELVSLADNPEKKALIRYQHETKIGKDTIVEVIEDFQSLISLPTYTRSVYNENGEKVSKKSDIVVILHPIFIHEISKRFILYPTDILPRLAEANGSRRTNEITMKLLEYFAREYSYKRHSIKIRSDNLYQMIALKYLQESRISLIRKELSKALSVMQKIGLLMNHEEITHTDKSILYMFELNKDWL